MDSNFFEHTGPDEPNLWATCSEQVHSAAYLASLSPCLADSLGISWASTGSIPNDPQLPGYPYSPADDLPQSADRGVGNQTSHAQESAQPGAETTADSQTDTNTARRAQKPQDAARKTIWRSSVHELLQDDTLGSPSMNKMFVEKCLALNKAKPKKKVISKKPRNPKNPKNPKKLASPSQINYTKEQFVMLLELYGEVNSRHKIAGKLDRVLERFDNDPRASRNTYYVKHVGKFIGEYKNGKH